MHAVFLTLLLVFTLSSCEGKTCSSIDVRNSVDKLEVLRNCTVIAGSLQIVLIENTDPSAFDKYSFPELREITDYLLFYRVKKLTSLGKLFPNLAVIRGQNLFSNYALVIYEMNDLEEIGLYGLLKIFSGNVRIEKNFKICYMNKVNWKIIFEGEVKLANNGEFCNGEYNCPSNCSHGCWNDKTCQKILDTSCPGDCLYGCKENDECEVCRYYIEDKKCVSNCSENRYLVKHMSRCVTENDCRALEGKWWTFGKDCINQCPPKYEEKNGTCIACESSCHKICNGTMITNINSIKGLQGCTNITGYIIIRLDTDIKDDVERELTEHLGNIEEIDEYLRITRSMQIKNLNFLKNLQVIKGKKLEQNRYSLIIHENQNLQKLWDIENFKLNIYNGTFSFHYNPKLCPSEIDNLAKISHLTLKYSSVDVSNHSNGDSFACSEVNIKVQVINVTENSVILQWKSPPSKDCKNTVKRFIIYYKEVIDEFDRNGTIYSEEDKEEEICGIPTWIPEFAFNNGNDTIITCDTVFSHNITALRTFTNYTFFVRTDSRLGGRSEIQYFMTLSGDPSVPMNVKAEAKASDAIKISWDEPININGILSHYIIVGFLQEERQSFIDQRNYCKVKMIEPPTTESIIETTTEAILPNDTCSCKKKDTGPLTVIQKEDFDAICSDVLDKVVYNEAKGVQSHGCGSYKYHVIPSHKTYLEQNVVEKREETTMKPNSDGKLNQLINGVYHVFEKHVNGNETSVVIDKLKHFSIYILLISACNENRTEVAQCSSIVMVSQRTGKKESADDIDSFIVKLTNIFDVELEWFQPTDPNSVIVSYDIEYKNLNKEKSKPDVDCITRKQHEELNNKYKIKNLHPGKYEIQVRATSLAGPGNPSALKTFVIKMPAQTSPVVSVVISFIVLIIISLVAYLYWRLKVRRSIENRQLIANVNPDYAGYQEDEWEIDRDNIEMQQVLGQGTFGQVYSGIIKNRNIPCAVKTVNEQSTMHDRMEFLNEATVMKAFNEAHHVVRLMGVISRGPQPYVVMELMARGDLKSFLRTTRDSSTSLTCSEMYRMAAEIADGMAYLSAKKFVHRDLAARNCMVSADRTVKIGDFGMTRDIYETDYYRKETRGLLPVRWMAPESLADGVFTSDSDVWSYGIVLWEIATLAEQPYQGLANEQVLQYVVAKGVLERPLQCPDLLYEIMAACYKWYPFQRPLFIDVVEKLENHIGQDFRLVSFYHSREGEEYRRNKAEINRERALHMGAIPEGRVHWNRHDDSVHFVASSPVDSPASVSLLSCQQHSLPNKYSPTPGTSYKT